MFASLNKLRADQDGMAAVEFALFLPVLLIIFVGVTEIGRALYQANSVEKGLRAGAHFAARSEFPLPAAVQTAAKNLVKTGDVNGGGSYVTEGWGKAGATLDITVGSYDLNGTPVPVVRLSAVVPFVPLLPGMNLIPGFAGHQFRLSHEQAYIGD